MKSMTLTSFMLLAAAVMTPSSWAGDHHAVKHVLLISVDGLHQSDLEIYARNYPNSTLARMVGEGVSYSNARTPFPSDSFPGMVAQVTGGNPKTTGIYYDDAYSRDLLPAGTALSACRTTAKGAEVYYAEVVAKDFNRIDSGQGIPDLYKNGATDLSRIFELTGQPHDLIDPATLPVDPQSCRPVYPHEYLKVNTVFEVIHQRGLRTAWSDKHVAYEILSGPSGRGIDDLFAPEINSNFADPGVPGSPNYGSGPDWTKDNTNTQRYDAVKVQAVLNWIAGYDHAHQDKVGTPTIFGMNFQSVSTAQKLNKSSYYVVPADPGSLVAGGLGGYSNTGAPGPVVLSALNFVDEKLAQMINAIDPRNTVVILSAKHGQSPINRADLTVINDGNMIDALNAAWSAAGASSSSLSLVAHAIDDDGILMWLNDRSPKALAFAKSFLWNYSGNGIGSDAAGNPLAKPFSHAGVRFLAVGEEAADVFGVKRHDGRVPDVVGMAQQGVVWAGGKLSKIAEHGGNSHDDRHVPIVVWGAGVAHATVAEPVATAQIAPSILDLLGIDAHELQAVRQEGTRVLPELASPIGIEARE